MRIIIIPVTVYGKYTVTKEFRYILQKRRFLFFWRCINRYFTAEDAQGDLMRKIKS